MKATGKRYFEMKVSGRFGSGDVVKVSTMGKGRNEKVVVRGGGRIVAIPLIRTRRGPLKEARKSTDTIWNPEYPQGFHSW